MARTKTGVGPVQTAQVIFMIDPKVAGEVEAWRVKRGISIKSNQYREIFLAGLDALRPGWQAEYGNLSRAKVNAAIAAAPRGEASKAAEAAATAAVAERLAEVKPAKRATKRARKSAGTAAA